MDVTAHSLSRRRFFSLLALSAEWISMPSEVRLFAAKAVELQAYLKVDHGASVRNSWDVAPEGGEKVGQAAQRVYMLWEIDASLSVSEVDQD